MKKSIFYLGIIILSIILVVFYSNNKKNTMIGIYLKSTNESNIIVTQDGGPIVMFNKTNKENIFDNLKSGDKIEVSYDFVLETYPGRTNIYSCTLIEKGSLDNIPKDTLDKLQEMDWTFDLSN